MLDKIKNMYQNDPLKTIAIGVGAVIIAPTVASLLKPVAKATIKTGVILYQKTKETIAETGEQLGDLVAEAQAEVLAEKAENRDNITVLNPSSND
ncbi:DUF5132 domain-containing protein [Cyanobacterium aponinum UTEX 3222]|uniref:DUF5132 domain-containing protein n=2 Tax=Cyanobacterium aponinum TaxID=379064 RepID=K9Z9V1_CYAAP|nr:DUF5132 domain-containing protein [Cyanobacterium aponinum]AFZ55148.1 hypothetical protein Cyan10605_3092 [Cyanobacterium aponinum PCC 10605]PHV61234.1 DUF5132 domain-containing protein [Cyanobacterium aponinum IPPAS B-1201]WPF88296.1 DUF5132 domain-containing protein [Cyanobacterium aponinum AL20115]WRL42868.1 DUF5132 domain-containing protein [Cyanobacterium aponinum UTEX 3222]